MKNKFRFIPLITLIVLISSIFTYGQEQFGNIEGFVKDSAGAVVPNIPVTVRSSASSTTAEFQKNCYNRFEWFL